MPAEGEYDSPTIVDHHRFRSDFFGRMPASLLLERSAKSSCSIPPASSEQSVLAAASGRADRPNTSSCTDSGANCSGRRARYAELPATSVEQFGEARTRSAVAGPDSGQFVAQQELLAEQLRAGFARRSDSTTHRTAGCPVFNDQSELVGLQSQLRTEGEGVVNRVVSIVTIVKHLFANAQLSKLQQKPLFQDLWDTWYIPGDSTRVVSIMANFKHR